MLLICHPYTSVHLMHVVHQLMNVVLDVFFMVMHDHG